MARKGKSTNGGKNHRRNKIEPSALTLYFAGPVVGPGSAVHSHIDLSQVTSLMNRRFYRQGLNWAVAGFKITTEAGYVGACTVSKLPNTWILANSWEKSMRAWMKLNREAMAESESIRPRFLDFKIYANERHHAAGYAANLLPLATESAFLPGEWEASKFVVPDTTSPVGGVNNFEIVGVGPSYPGGGASGLNAVSLIEGYANSRSLPNILDPNTPDDASDADGPTPENYLAALFNDGTTQVDNVVTDLITENNLAPYPFENDGVNLDTMYPGGANQGTGLEIHDFTTVTGTTIGGISRLKGGNFPCGLIEMRWTNTGETGQVVIQIDLIPGNHRGFLAESMTEM